MRRALAIATLAGLFWSAAAPGRPSPARTLDLGPFYARAVGLAVDGAARRLQRPECRQILGDFRDKAGVPLQTRLDALGIGAPDYLGRLIFTDGFGHRLCREGRTLALTAPGSRVVYVCGEPFRRAQARRAAEAEVAVLHEALHTLGLGENPPGSLEISRRIEQRCVPRS
jgi:hypothetical protein